MIAIEPDRSIRHRLTRLRIWPTNRNTQPTQPLRELRKQPRARRKPSHEPHALHHAPTRLHLRLDRAHRRPDTRLEQLRDLLARQFELPGADAYRGVLVERRAEGDVLRLAGIPEEPLGGLVEPPGDVVEAVARAVARVGEFVCKVGVCTSGDED
jgi:hypothetical protein